MTQEQDNRPSEAVALLPCPNPWCGSHDDLGPNVDPSPEARRGHFGNWRVRCTICPVEGPTAGLKSSAIAAWNTRAHPSPAPTSEAGWIVGNGAGTCWRMWKLGNPVWTNDRAKATRYARREDAEAVHAEDEDAWSVVPYSAGSTSDEAAVEAAARAIAEGVGATCRSGEAIKTTDDLRSAELDIGSGYDLLDIARAAITAHNQARPVEGLVKAARESLRQIEKYAEFFCDEDYDPAIDQLRRAIANWTAGDKDG